MLYLSTRSKINSYTAHRALLEERAPDGGLYVPFQLTQFSNNELRSFKSRTFSENIAYILNIFFSKKLSSWDVEFCCGRCPVKQTNLPHRLHLVELWHNADFDYAHMEQTLYRRLTNTNTQLPQIGWAKIAIRIAVLFAIYGETSTADSGLGFDVAVDTAAFTTPVAAWYARQMGLPIGTIVCGTHSHGDVWDLLHLGTMNTNSNISELAGIERLIYFSLGSDEVQRYVSCCNRQRSYHLEEDKLIVLSSGFFAAVVSSNRLPTVISNFYRSHGYVLDNVSGISFSALQDYRARTGESKNTLIMSLISPVKNAAAVMHLLGISATELEVAVNKQRG